MNALPNLATVLLLAAFAAGSLLHLDRAPPWCLAVALAAVWWRWLHQRGRLALPNRWLRAALAMLLAGSVVVSFRSWGGLAAGSALLIVMGAAKLLETRTRRDAVVVATVALILVLAAALERQALARLPLYLATGWIALASITAMGSHQAARSARLAFSRAGTALLLALPLAALCFVLVPRLPGALWSVPTSERTQTGLSDEMSPGSISDLAVSEDIAFRVRFEDAPPPPAERYWRGPVLHDFDGFTWRRLPGQIAVRQPVQPVSPPLRYRITLEPHGRNHLFVLDTVAGVEGRRSFQTFDGQVLAARPITAAVSYAAVSHLRMRNEAPLSVNGRRLDLRLPPDRNPRSIALARQLRAASTSDADYVQRVLAYFRDGGFEYSLTPPLLQRDSVDDLLFRSRLGFCGHFASAYVTLMRAAGVPARVVTGYQGGTWNRLAGYYTVRQSEAHAWAEVWLDDQGWTRVDPTSVVAPERLQRGISELLSESADAERALLGESAWLRDMWDAAGGWWQERVVNFNQAAQLDLLGRLGLGNIDFRGMGMLLLAGASLWMLLLWLTAQRQPRNRLDELARLWRRYADLLGSRGVAVAAHDGPDAIRLRAARALPEAATEIDAFTTAYARLRFGAGSSTAPVSELAALRRQLARIARATAARRRKRTAAAARG